MAVKKLLSEFSGNRYKPRAIHNTAWEYRKAGRYDKADQLYQYVVDNQSGNEDMMWVKTGIARLNIALGNDTAVEKTIDILIADFNDHPELATAIFILGEEYYNQAFQYQNKDSNDQAKERFYKAIALSGRIITELPESLITPQAYLLSGECYRHLGRHQEALGCYQRMVGDWPDCEYAWYAYLLIGCTYEQLRDSGAVENSVANAQIRAAYERILQDYPDCPAVRAASAWLNCYVKPSQGGQK